MPAMAGADADVPPTSRTWGSPVVTGAQSPGTAQMGYALRFLPLAAKRETSGKSRTPSDGTPVAFCQEGLGYPATQTTEVGGAPVDCAHLLGPPPPAREEMTKEVEEEGRTFKPNWLSQTCSGKGFFREPKLESLVAFQNGATADGPEA